MTLMQFLGGSNGVRIKKDWVMELTDELFDQLEKIEEEAKAKNLSVPSYAIRWVLDQPAVVSAIIGVKRQSQIDDAVGAVN